MKREKKQLEAILFTGQELASVYAEILRAIESPLPISKYAQLLLASKTDSALQRGLRGFFFPSVVLIGICTIAFRLPLSRAIESALYSLLIAIAVAVFTSKLSRRVFMPIVARIFTINYVAKMLVHDHIKWHLNMLARQYTAVTLGLPAEAELRKPISEIAETYRKMAEQIQDIRGSIYIAAPPIIATLLSQMKIQWEKIFSPIPLLMIIFAFTYTVYVVWYCFMRKRDIFKGDAIWLSPNLNIKVYAIENRAYNAIGVSKKPELPLDLIVGSVASLSWILWSFLDASSAVGVLAQLGAGPYIDIGSRLLMIVGIFWLHVSVWKRRVAEATA
jgi:hypothetical protein